MSGTKKLPKYVTYATLARFAAAADATFTIRLNAMEDRLRAEMEDRLDQRDITAVEAAGADAIPWEGNHLAPTPAEGAES